MKKYVLGCILFGAGFLWSTILLILWVISPWKGYGFVDFLIRGDIIGFFIVSLLGMVIGLSILLYEVGVRPHIPEWLKLNKML